MDHVKKTRLLIAYNVTILVISVALLALSIIPDQYCWALKQPIGEFIRTITRQDCLINPEMNSGNLTKLICYLLRIKIYIIFVIIIAAISENAGIKYRTACTININRFKIRLSQDFRDISYFHILFWFVYMYSIDRILPLKIEKYTNTPEEINQPGGFVGVITNHLAKDMVYTIPTQNSNSDSKNATIELLMTNHGGYPVPRIDSVVTVNFNYSSDTTNKKRNDSIVEAINGKKFTCNGCLFYEKTGKIKTLSSKTKMDFVFEKIDDYKIINDTPIINYFYRSQRYLDEPKITSFNKSQETKRKKVPYILFAIGFTMCTLGNITDIRKYNREQKA